MDQIFDMISVDRIKIIEAKDKESALKEMVGLLSTARSIRDNQEFEKAIMDREKILSTSIGLGIAIPHVRLDSVTDITIAIGVLKKGIEYESFDGQPVNIIIMIASPSEAHREYLRTLAKIALFLKNPSLRNKILSAENPNEIYMALKGL